MADQVHADAGVLGSEVPQQQPISISPQEESEIFQALLFPDDIYTPEGVYWADLPVGQRVSFVTSTDNAEAKRELSTIGAMMKKDPLSPVGWYFRNAVIPGAGLGLEGYVDRKFTEKKCGEFWD